MPLSFVPPGTALVPVPGELSIEGQAPRRVCAHVRKGAWSFASVPLTVAETDKAAAGLCRMANRGDLLPADEATAKACGVAFKPVEFVSESEGWRIKTTAPKSRSSAKE